MRHRRSLRIFLLCGVVAVGCKGDDISSPHNTALSPRYSTLPSGGSYSIPLPPDNQPPDLGGAPLAASGVIIPDSTSNFRMRVAGPFTLRDNPACGQAFPATYQIDGNGFQGNWTDGNPLRIEWSIQGAAAVPTSGGEVDPSNQSWVRIARATGGMLMLGRKSLYSFGQCLNGEPSMLLSGSQVVDIDFVDAPITLSDTFVTAGSPIHASATLINFTTTRAIYWIFEPDAGTATQVCVGVLSCDFTPSTSGRLRIHINTVGGSVVSRSKRISVLRCPTGDSVLDTPTLRDSLLAAMARSNPDSTTGSMKRREIGGLIFRNVDSLGVTRFYFKEAPTYLRQTACDNEWMIFGGNAAGDIAVASFHTHPNAPGDPVYGCPDPEAQQVPGGPGKPKYTGDAGKTGGGSDGDWNLTNQSGSPAYVMTKNGRISRLAPDTPKSQRKSNPNMWFWKNSPTGCSW